jgi:hypothetical protein
MKAVALALLFLVLSATWQDSQVRMLNQIGRVPTGVIVDVEAAPPYAFALEPRLLHVLDLTDPAEIRDVAQLEFPGIRWRMALHGSRLYLVGAPARGLVVVDVSIPASPRLLGELPEVSATLQDGIEIAGDIAFVFRNSQSPSLDVLDLAAPGELPETTSSLALPFDGPVEIVGTAVSEQQTTLFLLASGPGPGAAELAVVDVEDSNQPLLVRRMPVPGDRIFRDLAVAGDHIILLTAGDENYGVGGIAAFRFDDTEGLELLGEVSDPRLEIPIDLLVRDDAVFATFKGAVDLAVFDIADPSKPRLAFTHTIDDPLAAGLGMTLVDDALYVASDGGPLPIFDVSDAFRPRVQAEWAFEGGWTGDVFVEDGLAVTVRDNSGFEVYDVSDAEAPRRLSRYLRVSARDPWQSVHVARQGNRVFAVYDSLPAELIDLSDPAGPTVLSRYPSFSGVEQAVLTPTHAILGFGSGRLGLVDLSDPAAPAPAGEALLEGPITDLSLRGNQVVVAHLGGALSTVDINDPVHPAVIGRLEGSPGTADVGSMARIALSEDKRYAYIAQRGFSVPGTAVLTVVDLREPEAPEVAQRISFQGLGPFAAAGPTLVAARTGEVMIVAGRDLLHVDVEDARQPRLAAHYRLQRVFGTGGLWVQGDVVWIGGTEFGFGAFRLPRLR